jgi:formylmethanofuran dehydrogenase subunit C
MKNLLSIIFLFAASTLWAQETQTRTLGTFSGISVAEGIDVYLKKGDKESAKVEVTGTALSNVITEVSGSYLKIHMAHGRYTGKITVKVYLTYVKINKLSASSGGNIFSDETLKSSTLDLQASSAGTIEVTADAESISANASSAGEIEIQGKTTSVSADAASGGQVNAYELMSKKANAEASSGGSVKVSVSDEVEANASSGGSVRYRGDPAKSMTNSSSGGSVKKSN